MIREQTTLARLRSIVNSAATREGCLGLPAKDRRRYADALEKLVKSEDGPRKGIPFDLVKFSYLCKLIEDSIAQSERDKGVELAVIITELLTLRPVKHGKRTVFVMADPKKVVFDPSVPKITQIADQEPEE